jgi:hypothetical protein
MVAVLDSRSACHLLAFGIEATTPKHDHSLLCTYPAVEKGSIYGIEGAVPNCRTSGRIAEDLDGEENVRGSIAGKVVPCICRLI